MELIAVLVSALVGIIAPGLKVLIADLLKKGVGENFFRENLAGRLIVNILGIKASVQAPESLFTELSLASSKMDEIVKQVQEYTRGREQAVAELQSRLGSLSEQEQELKQRIHSLKDVPLPAAEYFANLIERREKRSALRDYVLFLVGVVVSAVVAVLLRKFGWA
jgi:hypothetical protein